MRKRFVKTSAMPESGKSDRAAWMAGKVGIIAHVLPDADDFGRIDLLDAAGLARQVAESGAAWFILTLGQNTGYYIAPNAAYERIAGYAPFSRCERRDIPAEVASALRGTGVRFGLYIPAAPANRDRAAGDRFGLGEREGTVGNGAGGMDRFLTRESTSKWAEVVAEWSSRYGLDVSLWWFDGCYPRIGFDNEAARLYKAAALSGNPDAAVAFNAGVRKDGPEELSDYCAGEANEPLDVLPEAGRLDVRGRQWHVLTYLGHPWMTTRQRFPDGKWRRWLAEATSRGGAVTLDIGTVRPTFRLDPLLAAQFTRVLPDAQRGGRKPAHARVVARDDLTPLSSLPIAIGSSTALEELDGELLRITYTCSVCGGRHQRTVTAGEAVEPGCFRMVPVSRVAVDGRVVSIQSGCGVFDLAALYPGETVKGRDGTRWATVSFDLEAPAAGTYRLFRHNDFYGLLSVNSGDILKVDGPFSGWVAMEIPLRKGRNTFEYRTRSGSGGAWTWGMALPPTSPLRVAKGRRHHARLA